MKPMKPCKAWGLVNGNGCLDTFLIGTRIWVRGFAIEPNERVARVRIIEDAAVERAIELLRSLVAGRPEWKDETMAAIRELGGKP